MASRRRPRTAARARQRQARRRASARAEQKIPSPAKPPAATSAAPTEPASSQPTLAMVTVRPNTAPRTSPGTSDSVAMSDGREVALTKEYAKPSATDTARPGAHISVGSGKNGSQQRCRWRTRARGARTRSAMRPPSTLPARFPSATRASASASVPSETP